MPAFARHATPSVARSAQAALTATTSGLGPLLAVPVSIWLLSHYSPASLYIVAAVGAAIAALVALPVALGRQA